MRDSGSGLSAGVTVPSAMSTARNMALERSLAADSILALSAILKGGCGIVDDDSSLRLSPRRRVVTPVTEAQAKCFSSISSFCGGNAQAKCDGTLWCSGRFRGEVPARLIA